MEQLGSAEARFGSVSPSGSMGRDFWGSVWGRAAKCRSQVVACCGVDIVFFPLSALRRKGMGWCSSMTWQGHSTPTLSWTSARRSSICSRWCLGVNWCLGTVCGPLAHQEPTVVWFWHQFSPQTTLTTSQPRSTSSSPTGPREGAGSLPGRTRLWLRCRAGGRDQLSPGWIPLTAAGSAFGKTDANYFLIVLAFGASSLLWKKKQ